MKTLEIYFRLIDKATAPARRIEKSFKELAVAAKRVDQTTRAYKLLRREFGLSERAARNLVVTLRGVAYARVTVDGAVGGMARGFGRLASAARGASAAIFNLRNLLLAGAAGYTLKFAVDVAAQKEAILTGFKLLAPGEEQKLFAEAVRFAARTPFSTQTIVRAYQDLLVARFKPAEIPVVLKGIGDVAAMRGFDPQVIDRIIYAFAEIKNQGRLLGPELRQLASAGVPMGRVYEAIAKKIGKSVEEVRKLQQAGRISADLGIWGVLEAIRTTISGGELGKVLDEMSRSIPGLLSTLRSRPFEFLLDVNEESGFGTFRRFLENLVNATDTTTELGKRIKARLENLFGGAFEFIFGPLAEATEADRIERTFDRIEAAIDRLRPAFDAAKRYVAAFLAGFKGALGGLKAAWDRVRPMVGWLERVAGGFRAASTAGGGTAATVFRLAGALAGLTLAWRVVNLLTLGGAGALVRWAGIAAATVIPTTWRMITGLLRLGAAWVIGLGPVGWLVAAVVAAVGALAYYVAKHWDEIKAAFGAAWDYVTGLWGGFTAWITGVFDGALAALASLPERFKTLAGSVWTGFLKGIEDAFNATKDRITGFFTAPVRWAKRVLGIQSPSRVFEYLGRMTALGYQRGLEGLKTATLAAAVPVVTISGPPVPATAPTFKTPTVRDITIHVHGCDPSETAQRVRYELAALLEELAVEEGYA